MDGESLIQLLSNQQSAQAPLVGVVSRFLSVQEAAQIIRRFQSENWIPNGQVLWSGILRERAQEWADRHRLQTLTTAMGPLMDEKHPECLKQKKNHQQWSRYIHGASAIFAWRIAQGEKVILLSPPPPERFHPSGLSYFQLIEEPIIRGLLDQNSVQKILITHPMIKQGENKEFYYELWPNDRKEKWVERFGSRPYKINGDNEWHVFSSGEIQQFESKKIGFIRPAYGKVDNATEGDEVVLNTAGSSLSAVSPEDINTEQDTAKRLTDEIKSKRKTVDKAQQQAAKKLKDDAKTKSKALDETHQEAAKKLTDEVKAKRKALDKVHQEATKKLTDEVKAKRKALDKAYQETAKKFKDEAKAKSKALDKTHQETAKKLKDEAKAKTKALDKAYQEAAKMLKDKATAKRKAFNKAHQETVKKLKDEAKAKSKALDKAHQEAAKMLKDKMNA